MMSAWFGGGRRRGEGGAAPLLIGLASMAIHFILTLFVLGLSRLREYYADQHSVSIVDDGSRKLSEALSKIVTSNAKAKRHRRERSQTVGLSSFKTLFIDDPDKAEKDMIDVNQFKRFKPDHELVREVVSRRITAMDKFLELFSSHPNIVKRLRNLQSYGYRKIR